jgi:hypothetical protein
VKLKLGRRQLAIGAVLAIVVVALLIGRSGKSGGGKPDTTMDDPARQACADFAAGRARATTKAARLALADKVTGNSGRSDNDTIARRAMELGNAAGDTPARWQSAVDALTKACHDAGWNAA